jgi:hypothetical protein
MKEDDEEKKGTEKKVDNPQYVALNQQMRIMNTEIANLEKDKALIESNYRKYSARVDATPKAELKLSEVLRENLDIRKEYDSLKGKLTEAQLAQSLESKQRGDQFEVLDPANFPIEPAKPNKWAILIVGILICCGNRSWNRGPCRCHAPARLDAIRDRVLLGRAGDDRHSRNRH